MSLKRSFLVVALLAVGAGLWSCHQHGAMNASEQEPKAGAEELSKLRKPTGTALNFTSVSAGDAESKKLSNEQRNAASAAYAAFFERYLMNDGTFTPEFCYIWSKRILDAESLLEPGIEARVKSLEKHVGRMNDMDKLAKRRLKDGSIGAAVAASVDYYFAEGNLWLSQARKQLKRAKERKD